MTGNIIYRDIWLLTDTNVPGRNIIVSAAIVFIEELSRFISLDMSTFAELSC